jgi:hypothetical protein
MTNNVKNPARQLASSIVTACKAKGLKQSTVLDVITKSQGFRSIQAADSVNSTPTLVHPVKPDVAFLQGVLLSTPDLFDMLPVDFPEACGKPALNNDFGDRFSEELWNHLYFKPTSFITFIDALGETLRDMELELEEYIEEHDNQLPLDVLEGLIMGNESLSDNMRGFLFTEAKERSDGEDNPSQECLDSIRRIKNDAYAVDAQFRENNLATQLCSPPY